MSRSDKKYTEKGKKIPDKLSLSVSTIFLALVFIVSYGEFYLYTYWKCPSCISDKVIPFFSFQTISLMKFFIIENSLIAALLVISSLMENKKLKLFFKTLRFLILIIIPVQFVAMYFTGEYIKLQPILQIIYIGFVINLQSVSIFLGTITVIFLMGYLIDFLSKKYCRDRVFEITAVLFAFNVMLVYFSLNNIHALQLKKYYSVNFYPPVREFLKLGYLAFKSDQAYKVKKLSDDELKKAKEYGFFVHQGKTYPLIKNFVYSEPFPFPKISEIKKPNIIILFVESLSAGMLNPYNPTYTDLTPNISDFSSHATVFDNYYNHTYPTIPGLQGQMASYYPPFNWYDWDLTSDEIKVNKLLSLPDVLKRKGYSTYYLTHSSNLDTFLKPQLLALGFDKTFFEESEFFDKYRPPKGFPAYRGADDITVFKVLIDLIKAKKDNQPFFIGVSTIETHSGYKPGKSAKKYPLNPQNTVLSKVHNLDYAFGLFWEWFKKSPYFKNTVVILTADHAHNPTIPYNNTFGNYVSRQTFDKISLIIYDPLHALPPRITLNATSLDLTPSVAHMLELGNFPNPWLGLSFFGDRQKVNKSLGLHNTYSLMKLEGSDFYVFGEEETSEKRVLLNILHFTQAVYINNRLWNNNIKINIPDDKTMFLSKTR